MSHEPKFRVGNPHAAVVQLNLGGTHSWADERTQTKGNHAQCRHDTGDPPLDATLLHFRRPFVSSIEAANTALSWFSSLFVRCSPAFVRLYDSSQSQQVIEKNKWRNVGGGPNKRYVNPRFL